MIRSHCILILCFAGCSPIPHEIGSARKPLGADSIVWEGKHAIDLRTGEVLWEIRTKEPWQGVCSEVAGSDVFVETRDRQLQRRRLADGRIVWSVPAFNVEEYKVNNYPDSPTIAATEQVILHAAQRRVKAHDRESGKLLWSQGLEPGGSRTLLVRDHYVFIPGVPSMLDLRTGRTVWKSDENVNTASYLPNGDLLVSLYDGVACLSGIDGRVLWKTQMTREPGTTLFAGRYLIAGSKADDDNAWAAVWDGPSGKQLWFSSGKHPVSAALSEDGETLYLGRWDHRKQEEAVDILALDTRTWSVRWSEFGELDGMVLLPVGPRVFVAEFVPTSFNTKFYCLSARDGSRLWIGKLEGIEVPHTIYGQGVELQIRGSWVALIDGQSAGSFVQAFQIQDGKPVSKWRILHD